MAHISFNNNNNHNHKTIRNYALALLYCTIGRVWHDIRQQDKYCRRMFASHVILVDSHKIT